MAAVRIDGALFPEGNVAEEGCDEDGDGDGDRDGGRVRCTGLVDNHDGTGGWTALRLFPAGISVLTAALWITLFRQPEPGTATPADAAPQAAPAG